MASIYRIPSGWRAQVRISGKPSTSKVFTTKAEAVKWGREQESPGLTDLGKSKSPHTVNSMIKVYRDYMPDLTKARASVLNVLAHYMGDLRIGEITPATLVTYARKRTSEAFPVSIQQNKPRPVEASTVLTDLLMLRVVLTHAGALQNSRDAHAAVDIITKAIPTLRHAKLVASARERDRRPTEDELQRLEEYCAGRKHAILPIWDVVLLAICTCMRRSEITSVTWEDYDEAAQTLVVRDRKDPVDENREDSVIPLLEGPVVFRGKVVKPRDILARQRTAALGTGRIFPWVDDAITAAFNRAVKALAISDLNFHDLRHDGISRLFEYGLDIPRVAVVSGHKTWQHLQRYTHIKATNIHEFALSISQKSPDRG